MELEIDRAELLMGLRLTHGVIQKRPELPILSAALLSASDDVLTVKATDGEMSIRRRCVASVKDAGDVATGMRKLYDTVRGLPDGPLKIRSLDNHWVEVISGKSRFRLVGIDPQEYTEVENATVDAQSATLPCSIFLGMIDHTSFAISTDDSRAMLNGLYVASEPSGDLRVVATDGHRLSTMLTSVDGRLSEQIILTRKSVLALRKVIESGEPKLTLTVTGNIVHIECGTVYMSARLIQGEFPNYDRVIPRSVDCYATVDVASFLAALRRVYTVSSEQCRATKIEVTNGVMKLSLVNPSIGDATDEIDIEYCGDDRCAGFNARYLIDALSILPKDGKIEFHVGDAGEPCLMREVGNPGYRYVVMPMNLQKNT